MYGENSGQLRLALGALLREHRIQQRLGGQGTHTVPVTTTVAEREELGRLMRRYREGVLAWSEQAVRAANPHVNLEQITTRPPTPVDDLRDRITAARSASTSGLATLKELTTEQTFTTVDSWATPPGPQPWASTTSLPTTSTAGSPWGSA